MKLDLSKFKKVKDSKDAALLQHPDGHHIRIAKKVLSPDMRNQLEKLPMHLADGTPDEPVQSDQNASYEPGTEPKQSPVVINIGGQALGSQPQTQAPVEQQPRVDPQAQLDSEIAKRRETMQALNPNWNVQPEAEQNLQNKALQDLAQSKMIKDAQEKAFAQQQESAAKQAMDNRAALGIANPQGQPDPNAQKIDTLRAALMGGDQPQQQMPSAQMPDINKGYQMFNEGLQGQIGPSGAIQQEANAQKNINNAQTQNYGQAIQQGNDINARIDSDRADMEQHTAQFEEAMQKEHIDPLNWWHEKSTGGKIMAGIGMLIGGMGNALLGRDPMGFVNNLIDRDINAQKSNLGIKKSIYDANMAKYHNENLATEMTRVNMNQMVQNMIAKTASQYGNPVVQAKANQMINSLKMDASSKLNEMAMRQSMLQGMGNMGGGNDSAIAQQSQYLRMMGQKDLADNIDKRHVPGIGMAQVEVPQDVRTKLVNSKVLDDAIVDLQKFMQQHGSAISKFSPSLRNEASAKAKRVQDLYRQANSQGVFREAEKDFVEGSIKPQPLQFFSDWAVKPGLENTRQQNLQQFNELKGSVGLPQTYKPASAVAFTGQ